MYHSNNFPPIQRDVERVQRMVFEALVHSIYVFVLINLVDPSSTKRFSQMLHGWRFYHIKNWHSDEGSGSESG